MLHGTVTKDLEIDHIDLNSMNNRADNLRLGTRSQNNGNTKRKPFKGRVRELPKGVYRQWGCESSFQAKIKINYKTECLGTYRTPEEASAAYMKRAKEAFGKFARQD